MQPFIISLVLATMAHLTAASPVSSRQGVARSPNAAVTAYGASTAAYKPRQAARHDTTTSATAGQGQGDIGQGNGKNTGKGKRATGSIPESLIPSFGVTRGAGKDRVQRGSCDGFANGQVVLVPCECPPTRAEFIKKLNDGVQAGQVFGQPIVFSTDVADTSVQTQKKRATAAIVVLQSFLGTTKGVGCPGSSYPNIVSQQKTGIVDTKVFS